MEISAMGPVSVMMVSLALPVRNVQIQMLSEKSVIKYVTVCMECVIKVQRGMDNVGVNHRTLGSAVMK